MTWLCSLCIYNHYLNCKIVYQYSIDLIFDHSSLGTRDDRCSCTINLSMQSSYTETDYHYHDISKIGESVWMIVNFGLTNEESDTWDKRPHPRSLSFSSLEVSQELHVEYSKRVDDSISHHMKQERPPVPRTSPNLRLVGWACCLLPHRVFLFPYLCPLLLNWMSKMWFQNMKSIKQQNITMAGQFTILLIWIPHWYNYFWVCELFYCRKLKMSTSSSLEIITGRFQEIPKGLIG